MRKWSEKEMKELREYVVSGLKAGNDILEIMDTCKGFEAYGDPQHTSIRVPEQVWFDVLLQLIEREEIDVIVT